MGSAHGLIIHHLHSFSYGDIVLLLGVFSHILAVPEEILLLIVGHLGFKNHLLLPGVVVVSILGIILADNFWYAVGWFGGSRILDFKYFSSSKNFKKYRAQFEADTDWAAFFSRFIVGARIAGPVLIGSLRSPWWRFALIDAAASSLQILVLVPLGFYFSKDFASTVDQVEFWRKVITFLGIVIITVVFVRWKTKETK